MTDDLDDVDDDENDGLDGNRDDWWLRWCQACQISPIWAIGSIGCWCYMWNIFDCWTWCNWPYRYQLQLIYKWIIKQKKK